MRNAIYKAMVGLPAKLTSAGATLMGLFGTFKPEAAQKLVGDSVTAENIQYVGVLLLIAAVIYFMLLWQLKPIGGAEGAATINQTLTSHGPRSPAIIGDGNTINFHAVPIITQERRKPYEIQPLQGVRDTRKKYVTWDDVESSKIRLPDMTAMELVSRLACRENVVDDSTMESLERFRKIALEITDQISLRQIAVWGRIDESALHRIAHHIAKNNIGIGRDSSGSLYIATPFIDEAGDQHWLTDLQFEKTEVNDIFPYEQNT